MIFLPVILNLRVYALLQDYESRIMTLQEQLERHSLMSSMTPDEFEDDEHLFGTDLLCIFI
jgi:hypothetical protein